MALELFSSIWQRLSFLRYLRSEEAVEDYCDELVDGGGHQLYLDSPVSVSGLIEIEDDCDYDSTHVEFNRRLILNGS